MLNQIVHDVCQDNSLWFKWTSLQVNLNTIVAEWHQDDQNIGTSAMVVGGEFSGGEFELFNHAPTQLRNSMAFFRGQEWHRSLKFNGTRVSIVAFTHTLTPDCKPSLRDRLRRLGFDAPPPVQ